MKLTFFLLLATFMTVSATTLAQKITLNTTDAQLKTVLKEFKKQSSYSFIIEEQLLDNAKTVTLHLENADIKEALDQLFHSQGLTYTIEDKVVTIKEKTAIQPEKPAAAQPPTDIIGRVTNTAGQPLNGASVIIKRTQTGVLTDANGNFTLKNIYPTDTLIVSFVGYGRQYFPVGTQTSLKIVLKEATNQLDQVVIQAYGETSQRSATGDIGTVTAKDIEKQPVMNVLDALQGQVAGVVVTNTTGAASGTVKVEIRGRNTIGDYPSDPLYVIDGVPLTILDLYGQGSYANGATGSIQSGMLSPAASSNAPGGQSPFFSINPSDIESISVLKDADATAIYGSRASNGVILITTKKGKAGKAHFDINVYHGVLNTPGYYQMLNTQQYVEMREEALRNDGLPVDINNAPDLVAWNTNRYTDWQKYLWGNTGNTTDINTSLSGGDATNTFRISAGFQSRKDIIVSKGDNFRGNLSFNMTHKSLNQRFSITLSGTYSYASINTIYLPGTINLPPNAPPIYDNNGNLNFAGWIPLDGNYPFGSLLQPYTAVTRFLNSSLTPSYEIAKGLVFRTNFGYNNINTTQEFLRDIESWDPASNQDGSSQLGYTFITNLIIEPQLEFNALIKKGKLDVLAGGSYQDNVTSSAVLQGIGYTNDNLLSAIGAAPTQFAENAEGDYKYTAIFARVNYNWDDKYILNLNFRRDGSSRFGPGRQFGNFGSAGMAYIFSEENWVKQTMPFLSLGKLRASYGSTGGDQVPDYSYLSRYGFGRGTYANKSLLYPLGHTDSLLHWQVNKKTEVAVELGFLKDRITLDASWYMNRCSDQLVQFPTPLLTGFSSVTSNSPADVQNTGLEFVLNGQVVNSSDFHWSAKFNIGVNRNKLLAYPNLAESPYAGVYIIGQPLNIVKVLHVTGVDPLTGLYTFEDKNKDGQITVSYNGLPDDRYPLDLSPKYDGGFTNTFTYKNWSLSLFFYFRKQIGINALEALDFPGDGTNQPIEVLNRWQQPGNITNVAKFTSNPYSNSSFYDYLQYSDAEYTDASFIRLQNLSLSYTFSDKLIKRAGMSACKVFIQGENIFTLTKYDGIDPETQSITTIPSPRILTIGVSGNF